MVNKKGVSSIVATVLLVLITVTVAGVIWQAVIPMVNKALQMNRACINARLSIDTTSGYTCYDENKKQASIMVSRGAEEFELNGLQIGLSSEGKTDRYEIRQRSEIDSYTKSLLHMEGSDSSTIFTDEMGKVVTANGNAQISIAGGSALFDGNGDYLSIPDNDDWNFGSGDFTIDGWIRVSFLPPPGNYHTIVAHWDSVNNKRSWMLVYINNGGTYSWQLYYSLTGQAPALAKSWTSTISTNTWHHIAVVRNGNNLYFFENGIQVGNTEDFSGVTLYDISGVNLYIGWNGANEYLSGWLDEIRISKGIARWTSNFIPQTNTYTKDAYTNLLLHSDGRNGTAAFIDDTGKTITANGNAQIDTAQYKVNGGKFSQAGLFDGSGDYLSVADSDDWYFGSGNFTIDLWVRYNDLTNYQMFIGQYDSSNAYWYFGIGNAANFNNLRLGVMSSGATIADYRTSDLSWNLNHWYHVAIVRNGISIKLYIDGVSQSIIAGGVNIGSNSIPDYTSALYVGQKGDNSEYVNGWLDEIRISKGIARWTSNFEVPFLEYNNIYTPQTNSAITYTISSDTVIAQASVAPIVKVGTSEKVCAVTHTAKIPKCA